jgi:hypothetical protein
VNGVWILKSIFSLLAYLMINLRFESKKLEMLHCYIFHLRLVVYKIENTEIQANKYVLKLNKNNHKLYALNIQLRVEWKMVLLLKVS